MFIKVWIRSAHNDDYLTDYRNWLNDNVSSGDWWVTTGGNIIIYRDEDAIAFKLAFGL